ncbi:MAG TPA: cysteine dioxygenase family protein, partial [Pyrinomonadaceae bacterium]|nr:cysteine dioxygenase family protein [Pyrinomonadaceae bacterium]
MSINFTSAPHFTTPEQERPTRILSFKSLIETLSALTEAPAFTDLAEWLSRVQATREDLRLFRFFKAGTYARHRVFRSDFAELLVLCWRPGQRTPIHDHNGSYGAVRVCEGVMWETVFAL